MPMMRFIALQRCFGTRGRKLRHNRPSCSLPSGILQRLAGVLISICLIACPVLAQSLEVIDLKYRTAAEVIPVLQPLWSRVGR